MKKDTNEKEVTHTTTKENKKSKSLKITYNSLRGLLFELSSALRVADISTLTVADISTFFFKGSSSFRVNSITICFISSMFASLGFGATSVCFRIESIILSCVTNTYASKF